MGACCDIRGCSDTTDAVRCVSGGGVYHAECNCLDANLCNLVPCCFPSNNYSCERLSVSDCNAREGIPLSGKRCCAQASCFPTNDYGACCRSDGSCEDGVYIDNCQGSGDFFADSTRCSDLDCVAPVLTGACCAFQENCLILTALECSERNGNYMGDGFPCEQANCDEAIEPDYCRKANFEQLPLSSQPRMADGKLVDRGLRWTTDLCALAIMLPTIRNVRHYPKGDNSFGWESHLFEPVSKTPIRAMEPSFTAVDSEPCRYHFGGIVLLPNGEFAPVLMSQPFNGKENSIELSIGAAAVRQKPDPDDVMEQGEMYFAAAYHTPYWTEAEFFSKQSYCGGAIP